MREKRNEILCIAWAPSSPRMDELATELGGRRANLTLLYGSPIFAILRYPFLFFQTLLLLLKERPETVYAQNPAIFCPLTCLVYCKLARKRLVIDHHCVWAIKSFRGTVERIIFFIEKFVDRQAYANTCPHSEWARILSDMKARNVTVIYDYVERNPFSRDPNLRAKYLSPHFSFLGMAPHGGHPLERIDSEAKAAASFDSLSLLITGPKEKLVARLRILGPLPQNVKYLGLLSRDEYEGLKASADFGLNISDEPHTLSHSLLEFASASVPVISTRQAAVRELFGDSILYSKSSSSGDVAEMIALLVKDRSALENYRKKIEKRFQEMRTIRQMQIRRLKDLFFDRDQVSKDQGPNLV